MAIVPHDSMFKTQLYKSICSIAHSLPLDVAERIRAEVFEMVNNKLKTIQWIKSGGGIGKRGDIKVLASIELSFEVKPNAPNRFESCPDY